ncbi:MAG TPA: hypothetical protein VHH88_04865 [Verrucomicrobiae bacterium]|nr:hypothetical protein [Verrucomicrobiae bacterium]
MAKAVHVWEDPGGWSSGIFSYQAGTTSKYTANEMTLDLSASYLAGEHHLSGLPNRSIRHGLWGGDVGLNYFITRYIGIGGDVLMDDNGGAFADQALGNLILRWPIDPSGFAPYVFGGGGRGFENPFPTSAGNNWEWLADVGVGLEFRMNSVTGLFVDGRYVWGDQTGDRVLLRTGLRLAF